jgi:hypothetical protein
MGGALDACQSALEQNIHTALMAAVLLLLLLGCVGVISALLLLIFGGNVK